jgi:hypothetical protein
MSHSVFIVVAVIKPDRLESLRRVLDTIEADPAANPRLPFGQFRGLHFASFVIFECPDPLKGVPRFKDPILVFENNIDGAGRMSQKTYLAQLVASGPGIDDVYEHSVDYPGRAASPESKLQYLLDRVRKPQLYHVGTPYRTVGSIKEDADRRKRWDRKLEDLMRPSLPAQLRKPAAGTEERWIWERLRQRISRADRRAHRSRSVAAHCVVLSALSSPGPPLAAPPSLAVQVLPSLALAVGVPALRRPPRVLHDGRLSCP